MACTASAIIATAKAELGYKEKKTNSSLYDPTANAGSGNYNKYAYEIDTNYPTFYNGRKNGYAWCDCFVDWLFLHTFGLNDALRLTCQPLKSAGAACPYSYNYYKQKGRTGTSPRLGAQIFFGTANNLYHTGIVIGFDSTYVYTIEGNTSDMVAQRTYKRVGSAVYGYGYPDYDAEGSTGGTTTTPPAQNPPSNMGTFDKTIDWYGWTTETYSAKTWPGPSYSNLKSIGALTKGTKVGICSTVKGSDGKDWYYIVATASGNTYGFVPASVITKTDPASATTPSTPSSPSSSNPITPTGVVKTVAWNGVLTESYTPRTWAGATTTLKSLGTLASGTVIGVCSQVALTLKDTWYYCKVAKGSSSYYCFIPSTVVKQAASNGTSTPNNPSTGVNGNPATTTTPGHTVQWTGTITTTCTCRCAAGSKNAAIKSKPTLTKGTSVGVCFQEADKDGDIWYLCKVGTVYGYVSSDYVKATSTSTPTAAATTPAAPADGGDDSGKYTTE